MRISEFSRAVGTHAKQSLIAFASPMLIADICLFIYMPFQQHFESFLSTRFNYIAAGVLATAPKAGPVILGCIAMFLLIRRVERKYGLACEHCGKSLAGYKSIVIASRNCPHCGQRVLED